MKHHKSSRPSSSQRLSYQDRDFQTPSVDTQIRSASSHRTMGQIDLFAISSFVLGSSLPLHDESQVLLTAPQRLDSPNTARSPVSGCRVSTRDHPCWPRPLRLAGPSTQHGIAVSPRTAHGTDTRGSRRALLHVGRRVHAPWVERPHRPHVRAFASMHRMLECSRTTYQSPNANCYLRRARSTLTAR